MKTPAIKNVRKKSPPVESINGASISSHTTVELLCQTTSGKWDFPNQITQFIGVTTPTQPLIRTVSFVPFIPNIQPSSRWMSGHH